MFDLLLNAIHQRVMLSIPEQEELKSFFIQKKIRRRQYLLQQDDVARYTTFVSQGLLRLFAVDNKGSEHSLQFAPEGWWITDMNSFLTGAPSSYCIDALEDSELLMITKDGYEHLLDKLPKMERFFRIISQHSIVALQKRLFGSFKETAEERYLNLIDKYPDIVQRVPQHMIASYIGVTPETISRIRKGLSDRK